MAEALSLARLGPGMIGHPLLRRRLGWTLLAAVTAVHLVAVDQLVSDRYGWGAAERVPPRIEVAFVRELAQTAPPVAAAPAAPPRAAPALPAVATKAAKPARPASAPAAASAAAVAPAPAEPVVPSPVAEAPAVVAEAAAARAVPEPVPPPAVPPIAQPAPAAAAPASASSAPAAQAFEWPPSTRLTYSLSGNYRGPIEGGRAQVDWLRVGSRYQVILEASVGPLFSRRVASEGELGERGLAPRRFDAEQKVLFRAPRRWTQLFGPERITLGDGREVDTIPGAQDEASQFVQLTWLFTTRPQLLQVGRSIEVPLAIRNRFDRWTYDVKEEQTLTLPFGAVPTFYVKPRREAKGGDMTAEIWFAPTLQYLPVRIVLRTDESTFVDLTLDRPPMQAAK